MTPFGFFGSIPQDSLKIERYFGNIEPTHQILINHLNHLNHLTILLQLHFPTMVCKCKKHVFKAKGDKFGYYWDEYFWAESIRLNSKNKLGHAFIHWLPKNSMPIDRLTFYHMPFYTSAFEQTWFFTYMPFYTTAK